MTSPFLNYSSGGTSNMTVNSIKPNPKGNILIPLSSLSDVPIASPTSAHVLFL